jgi:hypothetical protein
MQHRSTSEVDGAIAQLRPFAEAGYTIFPLQPASKVPAHDGWRTADYSAFDYADHLRRGGNLGIRLGPDDVVLDVDPRNGGDESFKNLQWLLDEEPPRVRTGGDGLHLFLKKPLGVRLRGQLAGYSGIDLKAEGGFVVAPGSVHPETGKRYEVDPDAPPIARAPVLPQVLLDQARRPEPAQRTGEGGELTAEQLAVLLEALDPRDYADYDDWMRLSAACHDAVAGDPEGMAVWLEWCIKDESFAANAAETEAKWETFTSGRPDGVSYRTLLKAIVDAGRGDLVRALSSNDWDDDIEGDPPPPPRRHRFARLSIDDLVALPPPAWLVANMVPQGALVQIYGRRKSNKTFVSLDLCLCIATGRPYHGTEVKRGRVTYVIGEGGGARFGDRVLAWCRHNRVDPKELDGWFAVVPMRVAVDSKDDLKDFLAGDTQPCDLIVFDTVARSMDGDENSTADMNRFVKGLDRVREAYSGTVMVVHHSGKDEGRQGRGSTALPGAVDSTIKVSRNAAGQTVVAVEEIRDAAPGTSFTFEPVNVIVSDDLRTSLAMRQVGARAEAMEPKTAKDLVLIRVAEAGVVSKRADLIDPSTSGMSKANVNKAIAALLEEGLLVEDQGGIRVTEDGEDAAMLLGAAVPQ